MANIILMIVGAFSLLTATLVITAAVTTWFLDWRKEPHQPSFDEGREYELLRLKNNSWWFSEHEPTMLLLQDLAEGMNVSDAREKWRKLRNLEQV